MHHDADTVLGWLEGLCLGGTGVLMCMDIGPFFFGFASAELAVVWMLAAALCAAVNAGFWGIYYLVANRSFEPWQRLSVTVLPAFVYLLTGLMCLNIALSLFAAAYAFLSCRRMVLILKKEREEKKKKEAVRLKKRKKA
ncbi:MAG: hypothetical protein E7330_06200 [Clostridiales bacterium]|nr:hypothetical protein [Clostridiales bacterium]